MPEQVSKEEVRARAFWSGTITFGLVSIPVGLYPATRSEHIGLRMVDESGTPLVRRYVCPEDGVEVGWEDIARGYEVGTDEYVVVTDEELEELEPRKSHDIDLRRFVPVEQLDPKFFERGYYLAPAGETTRAYMLLAAIMEQRGRAGLATFVMRGKEYLVAILAERGILRAETLRFADEIRSPGAIGLPKKPRLKAADVKKMQTEIRKHVSAELSPKELEDRYAQRLLKLVRQKERKSEDTFELPEEAVEEPDADVIDLMEVLRQSLRSGGRKTAGKTTRKTSHKAAGKKSARKQARKTTRKHKAA